MERRKISEFAEVITGGTPSTNNSAYWNGDIPWLPSGVCQDCEVTEADTYITNEGLENSAAKLMPPETVLIALTGATTGKTGLLKFKACANQSVTGILPNNSFVPKYLFYYLQSCRDKILSDSYGGAQKHISQSYVKNIVVDLPDIMTQQMLANTLDSIVRLISKRKQQLTALDDLVKSRFIEMFGDPVENPHGWLTKGLTELGSCKNGMNFGAKDIGVTIQSVGVGDIKDYDNIEDIESLTTVSLNEMPSEEYMLKDGDLVFVRSNGNKNLVGRCVAVYPHETPVTFSGFCIRFRKENSDVLIDYLLRYLKMPQVRAKMAGRGANIQNLNQKILAALQVPVPPIELQKEYVEFVAQADKSKFAAQKGLQELEVLKKSLMQQCFG